MQATTLEHIEHRTQCIPFHDNIGGKKTQRGTSDHVNDSFSDSPIRRTMKMKSASTTNFAIMTKYSSANFVAKKNCGGMRRSRSAYGEDQYDSQPVHSSMYVPPNPIG